MSKRPDPPNDGLLVKRLRRSAGFRFAQANPAVSMSSPSSNSVFFVTVNQDDRCGTLKANTQVLSHTRDPSPPTSAPTPQSCTPGAVPEPEIHSSVDSVGVKIETTPTPQANDVPLKPRRKRYTTNAVCYALKWQCLIHSNLSPASTQ